MVISAFWGVSYGFFGSGVAPGRGGVSLRNRRSGLAMVLVLIVLAVAFVLGLTYLSARSGAVRLAESMADYARAQALAESGLLMALARARTDRQWVLGDVDGVLVDEEARWAGDFVGRLRVEAGLDSDGDGRIDQSGVYSGQGFPMISAVGEVGVARYRVSGRILAWGEGGELSGPIPSYLRGKIVLDSDISLSGNTRIDALHSGQASYNPYSNATGRAELSTNTTAPRKVELTGSSVILGNLAVGPGGNPDQVIYTSGTSRIEGATSALEQAVVLPELSWPGNLPPSAGNSTIPSWGRHYLEEGVYRYSRFNVSGSAELVIRGQVQLYCDQEFTLGGSGRIVLEPGAHLTVWTNRFEMSGASQLNYSTQGSNPAGVEIAVLSHGRIDVSGSAIAVGQIIAPNAELNLTGNVRLFGAFAGQRLSLAGSSRFTQDLALLEQSGSSGGGSAGGSGGAQNSGELVWAWVENQP